MLPVLAIVTFPEPANVPGPRFWRLRIALQPELVLSALVELYEAQTVPELTWSLIVNVPEAVVLPPFVVSALNVAIVALPPKYAAMPIASAASSSRFVVLNERTGRGCSSATTGSASGSGASVRSFVPR